MTSVTVALPFSGEPARDLELAVRSVFAQSHQDWHLLLVGDDPREELIRLVEKVEDHRVTVQIHKDRGGLATRLNESIRATETQFYFRMDGDDVMAPTRIEIQLSQLRDSGADLVASRAIVIDDDGLPEGRLIEPPHAPQTPGQLVSNGSFTHPTVAGTTDWFTRHLYDERINRAEDMELWLRACGSSVYEKSQDALMFYRISRQFNRAKWVKTSRDAARVCLSSPSLGVKPSTAWSQALTHATKAGIYSVMPSKAWEMVRSRRIEPADQAMRRQWRRIIEGIADQAVPGWVESVRTPRAEAPTSWPREESR